MHRRINAKSMDVPRVGPPSCKGGCTLAACLICRLVARYVTPPLRSPCLYGGPAAARPRRPARAIRLPAAMRRFGRGLYWLGSQRSRVLLRCRPAAENQVAIGDQRSGSRASPVHLIPLLDEAGEEIRADDEPPLPFSVRQTCALKCHTYEKLKHGWHFNAHEAGAAPGRAGHPWILTDAQTRTQLPLSYRPWPGACRPEDVGLNRWSFVKRFGRHCPAAAWGIGKKTRTASSLLAPWSRGRSRSIACAATTATRPTTRLNMPFKWSRENFRWAAASTSAFASVSGAAKDMPDTFDYAMPEPPADSKLRPPEIVYRPSVFDGENRVFFPIVRRAPPERCYFCHSTAPAESSGQTSWAADEDVHLSAGLTCVDCHRNGLDHMITRGVEGEPAPSSESLSCRGCHLSGGKSGRPAHGRLGIPQPRHAGLPRCTSTA